MESGPARSVRADPVEGEDSAGSAVGLPVTRAYPVERTPFADLPHAHGGPLGLGRLRVQCSDFQVAERLGFDPDGEGEHWLLWVRKTDANTDWVAGRIAALAGVRPDEVGYAGLKDRRAVACQWFSLPRLRHADPDWSVLVADGIEVLGVHAHRRKLRRGALAANRFSILIRGLDAPMAAIETRLASIAARGVPSYFGEQRFGRGGANLDRADALFRGAIRRPSRHRQGLWISAARSQIFNQVLAERTRRGDWDEAVAGDCLNLAGSHSFFRTDTRDPTLTERCRRFDLHPTGPLWGAGEPSSGGAVRALEEAVAARFPGWPEGLARFGLKQERRSLRLRADALAWSFETEGLRLSFELSAGGYATSILRELIRWDRPEDEDGA